MVSLNIDKLQSLFCCCRLGAYTHVVYFSTSKLTVKIPRTTFQSLFRRFARFDLSLPVPVHILPEQFHWMGKSQQCKIVTPDEMHEKRYRANISPEFKLHIAEFLMEPDVDIACLAWENGINVNAISLATPHP